MVVLGLGPLRFPWFQAKISPILHITSGRTVWSKAAPWNFGVFPCIYPYHPCMVYLPLHLVVSNGKIWQMSEIYTSPMDASWDLWFAGHIIFFQPRIHTDFRHKTSSWSWSTYKKKHQKTNTPWKFNIAPENGWLEDEFPFGIPYFQGLC